MTRCTLLLVALTLSLQLCLIRAQYLTLPQPRNAGEIQFRPGSGGAQAQDDYCGGSTIQPAYVRKARRHPVWLPSLAVRDGSILLDVVGVQSTLFSGSPANYINTRFNSVPAGSDSAWIVITLLRYVQNGTSFNPRTNVTTPIYSRLPTVLLSNTSAAGVTTGMNYNTLSIDAAYDCGRNETGDQAIYTQTRCVLRWVFDNTPSGNPSRVSCADVVIGPRSDESRVAVSVALRSGEVAIQPATALRRVLSSTWALNPELRIERFQTAQQVAQGEGDYTSPQVRMDDPAITNTDGGYVLQYVFSDTTWRSAQQLATDFKAQDLASMLDVQVQGTSTVGSATQAAASIAILLLTTISAILMSRA